MALLSELVSAIAAVEGIEESFVAGVARYLREADLISQAGRGRGAARMTTNDAAALLIAVNATVLAKDAPSVLAEMSCFVWKDQREERYFVDTQAVADMSDELFNWIMQREHPLGPAKATLLQFMERLIYSAIPLSSKNSRLADLVSSEDTTFEIRFNRPIRKVSFQFTYYWENPDNVGDIESNVFEHGEFSPTAQVDLPAGDRFEQVSITQRTILEVGKALAS